MAKRKTQPQNGRVDAVGHVETGTVRASGGRSTATWTEWLPPERRDLIVSEITRDEVITHIQAQQGHGDGSNFTDDNVFDDNVFTYWVNIGLLPRSTRRRHEGSTRGFYPVSIIPTVAELMALREKGETVDELRDQAPEIFIRETEAAARMVLAAAVASAEAGAVGLGAGAVGVLAVSPATASAEGGTVGLGAWEAARAETDLVDTYLGNALRQWVVERLRTAGAEAARIDINVIDRDGKTSGYTIRIDRDNSWRIATRLSRRSRSHSKSEQT